MRKLFILALGIYAVIATTNSVYAQNPCTQEDERKYMNAELAYKKYLEAGTTQMSYSDYWEAAISQLSQGCRTAIWQMIMMKLPPGGNSGSACTKNQLRDMVAENGRNNYQGPLANCKAFRP